MDDTWITCVTPPWWIRLRCLIVRHDWHAYPIGLKLRRECTLCHLTVLADGKAGYTWVPQKCR